MSEMQALAEELREYTAMKYAGDCKCGKCQLVPRALVERIYHTLNGSSVRCSAVSAEYQRCMDMLGDVPGPTLEDRLTRYIGCYMALQIKAGAQPQASVESAEPVCRHEDYCLHPNCECTEPQTASVAEAPMTEDQIKHMVNLFLGWKLPETFNPDNGISFDPIASKGTPYEFRRAPQGTNLLNATQADAMVRYMLEGLPQSQADNVTQSAVLIHTLTDIAAKRFDVNARIEDVCDMAESAIALTRPLRPDEPAISSHQRSQGE
jgi:hypothetical protein